MILLKNNYYEEDERLFSTGDSELDDILEEVYYSGISDGYDYAQKEFAKKSEEEKKQSRKEALEGAGAGILVGTAASGVARPISGKLYGSLKNEMSEAENEALTKKLYEKAKKQGTEIVEAPEGINSAYYGLEGSQKARKTAKKIYNKLKKKNPEQAEQFKEMAESFAEKSVEAQGMPGTGKYLGKDVVALGKSNQLSGADVLSHELGHSALGAGKMGKGRSKDVVGKAAHKLYGV